jgi:2,3-bisphosphoglycerate-independent phosphoglycerate mutase
MLDPDIDQPYTAHTTNPVPLIYVGGKDITLLDQGALCDISPTILDLMGLGVPREMSGHSLIRPAESSE